MVLILDPKAIICVRRCLNRSSQGYVEDRCMKFYVKEKKEEKEKNQVVGNLKGAPALVVRLTMGA
jgi:hypothetical protein